MIDDIHDGRFRADVRRIVALAWPVFIGQLAVLGFATVDTILVARHSAADLAALAIGSSAYITIFVGFMGVVLALGPIVGRQYGAGELMQAGREVHQAVWLALALSLIGSLLLLFPAPFIALAQAPPEVAAKVQGYLQALAISLPAALLFTVFRGFNTAVSRTRAVMRLQVASFAIKVPLSAVLVTGLPAIGLPALGVTGCGIATAIAMWSQVLAGWWVLRRDESYAPFALFGRGLDRPDAAALKGLLKLGIPMGLSILVEVTGFSFMALFISRLGTTPVAGHQIAVNLVSLLFMMPLALANASGALVAQRLGSGHPQLAARLGWHGLWLGLIIATAMAAAVLLGRSTLLALYTDDARIAAAAWPLLTWMLLFHVADAAQTITVFVLRAYHITVVPVLIYVAALWGVGLGGGWWLAFERGDGAAGYWVAATAGLTLAGVALTLFMARVLRQRAPWLSAQPAR